MLLERADLVLRREESEEYLRQVAPDLPAGRLRPLAELANGWIAALRASTSAIGSDPSADPASWLLGPGLEVLFGRGLQVLDATDRDLLVLCSVLDQMSPEVCDAVTGRSDGAERLAALSERLLVARVPGPGPARYETHPLLREYLGRKLAERGRGAAAHAHEAAGVWLAENGDAEAAISHLLDCGRIELAREVLSAHVRDLLDAGRSEHVRTWYRRAPELAVPDHELLLLAGAWSELWAGDVTAAGVHLVELEAAAGRCASSARERRRRHRCGVAAGPGPVPAQLSRGVDRSDRPGSRASAHRRAAFGADWSRMAHQAAAFHEARLALWHGDPQAMRRMLMQLSGRAGTLQFYRQVAIPSLGALVAAEEGRAQRACFLADSALDALTESGRLGAVDACDARLARARALGDLGQTVAAASEAAVVQDTAAQVEHVPYLVLGAVHRARALAAGGHRAGAEQQLEAARAIVTQRSVRGPLRQALDRASAEVAIISGDRAGARRALEGLDEGRSRDVLAIRALSLGGQLTEAEAVRMIQTARPQSPREVVDARLAMVTFTAATRRPEAVMHLRAAAALANEHGMILALQGCCDEVLVLAAQLASQGADPAVAALVGALPRPAEPVRRAPAPLSAGEHQLLERLALFPGNRELAEDLGITANTLKTRLRRLYAKLGVHDRDAALRAARPGS